MFLCKTAFCFISVIVVFVQTMWEVTNLLTPTVVLCAYVALFFKQLFCFIWWTDKAEMTNTHSQS